MKGSLVVIGCFILGCLIGWFVELPVALTQHDVMVWVIYFLMFQTGLSVGSDRKLKEILSSMRPKLLLVPVATIVGTLLFSAFTALLLSRWTVFECMAVGSGFAYYSLSSILISQIKEPSLGVALATELGTIALIANILREIATLLLTPLMVRFFGPLAPICAGGATTMDTTLPAVIRYSGKEYVFLSIFHGILVDFTVPFLVPFFCSL